MHSTAGVGQVPDPSSPLEGPRLFRPRVHIGKTPWMESSDDVRRLPFRVGRGVSGGVRQGCLAPPIEGLTHEGVGAASCDPGSLRVLVLDPGEACAGPVGQRHCGFSHQPPRWGTLGELPTGGRKRPIASPISVAIDKGVAYSGVLNTVEESSPGGSPSRRVRPPPGGGGGDQAKVGRAVRDRPLCLGGSISLPGVILGGGAYSGQEWLEGCSLSCLPPFPPAAG